MINLKKQASISVMTICCMIIMMLQGCNKAQKVDMTDLISTVPATANGVVGINLHSILEKMGCKVENGKVSKGDISLENLTWMPQSFRDYTRMLANGESGIDPEGAIVFYDANRCYLTLALSDVDLFKAAVEKVNAVPFEPQGNLSVCENVAIKGAQAWILINGGSFDSDLISSYTTLDTSQSFISNSFGASLTKMQNDLVGWGKMSSFLQGNLTFTQNAQFNVVNSLLFEEGTALSFKIDFLKGKADFNFIVLNEKNEPAKYLLSNDKINTSTVESIAKNAGIVLAFNLDKKLVEKIDKTLTPFFGQNVSTMINSFSSADGTFAIAFSIDDPADNLSGVITTNGNPSMELKTFVSNIFGPMRMDGKLLRFSKGVIKGSLDVEKTASEFKGATIAAKASAKAISSTAPDYISDILFKGEPEGKGLKFEVVISSGNTDENILQTFVKSQTPDAGK